MFDSKSEETNSPKPASFKKHSAESKQQKFEDRLQMLYATFDKEDIGYLLPDQLREFINEIRLSLYLTDIDDRLFNKVFSILDSDGNGQIEYEEFVESLECVLPIIAQYGDELEKFYNQIFLDFDTNQSGEIEYFEFKQLMNQSCDRKGIERIPEWRIQHMFKLMDDDRDNFLSYNEFANNYHIIGRQISKLCMEKEYEDASMAKSRKKNIRFFDDAICVKLPKRGEELNVEKEAFMDDLAEICEKYRKKEKLKLIELDLINDPTKNLDLINNYSIEHAKQIMAIDKLLDKPMEKKLHNPNNDTPTSKDMLIQEKTIDEKEEEQEKTIDEKEEETPKEKSKKGKLDEIATIDEKEEEIPKEKCKKGELYEMTTSIVFEKDKPSEQNFSSKSDRKSSNMKRIKIYQKTGIQVGCDNSPLKETQSPLKEPVETRNRSITKLLNSRTPITNSLNMNKNSTIVNQYKQKSPTHKNIFNLKKNPGTSSTFKCGQIQGFNVDEASDKPNKSRTSDTNADIISPLKINLMNTGYSKIKPGIMKDETYTKIFLENMNDFINKNQGESYFKDYTFKDFEIMTTSLNLVKEKFHAKWNKISLFEKTLSKVLLQHLQEKTNLQEKTLVGLEKTKGYIGDQLNSRTNLQRKSTSDVCTDKMKWLKLLNKLNFDSHQSYKIMSTNTDFHSMQKIPYQQPIKVKCEKYDKFMENGYEEIPFNQDKNIESGMESHRLDNFLPLVKHCSIQDKAIDKNMEILQSNSPMKNPNLKKKKELLYMQHKSLAYIHQPNTPQNNPENKFFVPSDSNMIPSINPEDAGISQPKFTQACMNSIKNLDNIKYSNKCENKTHRENQFHPFSFMGKSSSPIKDRTSQIPKICTTNFFELEMDLKLNADYTSRNRDKNSFIVKSGKGKLEKLGHTRNRTFTNLFEECEKE